MLLQFNVRVEIAHFVRLVEDGEFALILVSRSIFEILDILSYDLSICDEIPLSIYHIGYHHDLIRLLIWEFKGLLARLDVVRHDYGFGTLH